MKIEQFTFEERNLLCIYNVGTRTETVENLTQMMQYLQPDEIQLQQLSRSVLQKLEAMTEADFRALDLIPDF